MDRWCGVPAVHREPCPRVKGYGLLILAAGQDMDGCGYVHVYMYTGDISGFVFLQENGHN